MSPSLENSIIKFRTNFSFNFQRFPEEIRHGFQMIHNFPFSIANLSLRLNDANSKVDFISVKVSFDINNGVQHVQLLLNGTWRNV